MVEAVPRSTRQVADVLLMLEASPRLAVRSSLLLRGLDRPFFALVRCIADVTDAFLENFLTKGRYGGFVR